MTLLNRVRNAVNTEATQGPALAMDLDDTLHLIANERRRRLITMIDRHNTEIQKSELARLLAGWEHQHNPHTLDNDTYKAIYVTLHQVHLPKLADHDVIEYDPDRGTVAPTDRTSALAHATQTLDDLTGGDA